MMFMSGGRGSVCYHCRHLDRTGRKHFIYRYCCDPQKQKEYFFILDILVYILYVHFYKWSTNNFYLMLKNSEPSLNNNKSLNANFTNNPGGVVLFVRQQRWFTVCETVACFHMRLVSLNLWEIFLMLFIILCYQPTEGGYLVLRLYLHHMGKQPLLNKLLSWKKVNIRALVTSHMEDLEQWLRMSPQVLNLGQSCSTIINVFAINGALREKYKGSKINLWGIRWE